MSSDDAVSGDPAQPVDDGFEGGDWEPAPADLFADPSTANLFTAEIEHVDASVWDVDSALIWGDEGDDVLDDGGSTGLDLPL